MRSLLRDGLRTEACVLHEAEDGEESLVSVLRAAPDLIITEIHLAGGGVEYIARLRVFVPNCPIVVMTAFGDEWVKTSVLRAGATAYFNKPAHLSELRACVRRLLSTKCAAVDQSVVVPEVGR
ncbi:MAG: hypothetical protein RL768_2951 [Nitrospirota bacterium]|jgi:DNA-binding response OmpR family regulator